MNWKRLALVGLLVGMVALAGCSTNAPGKTVQGDDGGDIHQVVLEEDGVVCYITDDVEETGMSCLPINETSVLNNSSTQG